MKSVPNAHHYSGVLLVTETGKLIGQQRDDTADIDNPGKIATFGGTVEPGEDYRYAAWRELVREETNLTKNESDLKLFYEDTSWRSLTSEWEYRHFYTVTITQEELSNLKVYEGKGWAVITNSNDNNLVEAWRVVIRAYISSLNTLYNAAIEADSENNLTEWFVKYLRDSGRNSILADGLEEDGQFHTALIQYPIDKLKILRGPDASYRYPEEPSQYEERVSAMLSSLEDGWKPVPLIATQDIWNPGLELNDGAHRVEALKRFGVKTYPTVIYFKDSASLDQFVLEAPNRYE